MKLYEVPTNTRVKLLEEPIVPPGSTRVKGGDILVFSHIDGMYSYCLNKNNKVVHIAAWSNVEIVPREKVGPINET